ncbi:hypothetical protein N7449_002486 [Penicillium cf. viridicatum]|uniref:Mitochondrial adapter protein MCP1 transmembrane domain-containing protein n=1 Tax=Penicillium cf. viridicatum TaxID=2972119 RepID=A0A9W9MV66_9EURO|nr:hypothetical protein N7449_002486 [Penicillium cf. viridicatum]
MSFHEPSKPEDIDTKSIISLQELDPSPVHDSLDVESGEYFPRAASPTQHGVGISIPKLGLSGHRWDSWLTGIQKYSTYPPTAFFILHLANTSLIPLMTRSVPASESYLLLTRPIYQAPGLEHLVLTIPIIAHVASGIALRNIRAGRRARLYGAETRAQRNTLYFWPRMSLQAQTKSKRQRKMWWVVNGVAAAGAALWLAGALGVVGRAGEGAGWEARGWNEMYSHIPIIGEWL